MAINILTVWKQGSCKSNCAITWVSDTDEDYKTFLFANDEDGLEVLLEVFGDKDVDFNQSKIYMTKVPSVIFIKAAKQKKVSKIIFIKNLANYVVPEEWVGFVEPFDASFGKVIDIFTQYETIGDLKHKYLL